MVMVGFCQTVRGGLYLTLAMLLLFFLPSHRVIAQQPATASWESASAEAATPPANQSDREREFADLARDARALEQQARLLKRVVKLVEPSVVHIDAKRFESHMARPVVRLPVEETGSGMVVQLDGQDGQTYILTNLHVVRGASPDNIRVRLADDREIHPTKMWSDPDTDLAVLAVSGVQLVPARIGNSDQVEIGDFVLAFGSPFGLSHSVTFGIVSAKGRRNLSISSGNLRIQEFLQTDAAINPGNSGGPLVNTRGEVVGINTAIASSSGGSEGIGFSIPINMALVVGRQLVKTGKVAYAYLGVALDSSFSAAAAAKAGLPSPGGARVKQITPGSPAEFAKLQTGDVIVRFNGIAVEDDTHLVNLVGLTPVGEQLPVVVFRAGQTLKVEVKLSERRLFDRR